MRIRGYSVEVAPLAERLGGGFVAYAPALRGCVSHGATRAEALGNVADAINCWLEAASAKQWRVAGTSPAIAEPCSAVAAGG